MKAGPKAAVEPSSLPFRPRSAGSARFAVFCQRFIRVPKGTGALSALRLRPWRIELVGSVLDADPQPRTAGWVDVAARSGQVELDGRVGLLRTVLRRRGCHGLRCRCRRGAGRHRVQHRPPHGGVRRGAGVALPGVQERLVIPARDAQFHCLPAEPKRLEGLDYTLAILDEAGVANRDSYEVLTLAQGKRERSTLVAIGTPGPNLEDQVLLDLRAYAAEHPDDLSLVWREFSAAGFEDHPPDCAHCWELANPALDDFLHRDALHALLPPKTRESTFRRARLCQSATDTEGQFLPAEVSNGLSTGNGVPDRAEVVIALDGSFSDDTTALRVGTVSPEPHFDVIRVWERPDRNDDGYRAMADAIDLSLFRDSSGD